MKKKRRNNKHLVLSHRDGNILKYLFERKLATLYQIKKHLKISSPRQHLSSRLNRLVTQKYLNSTWYERKKIFYLGSRGIYENFKAEALKKAYPEAFLGYNPVQPRHDLILNEVYQAIIETRCLKDLKTHNQLVTEVEDWGVPQKLPDALFRVDLQNAFNPWAVEVEVSLKSKDRYLGIFTKYYNDHKITGVLYLVESQREKERLQEIDRKFRLNRKSKICVARIDDFLRDPVNCEFRSSGDTSFSFYWNLTYNQRKEFESQTEHVQVDGH